MNNKLQFLKKDNGTQELKLKTLCRCFSYLNFSKMALLPNSTLNTSEIKVIPLSFYNPIYSEFTSIPTSLQCKLADSLPNNSEEKSSEAICKYTLSLITNLRNKSAKLYVNLTISTK